ncbi:hypothetical protein GN316_13260 [Xylophilus sp. Kf1]|nr:hypothetical protein [Xylophilus sp. Kf1]
MPRRLYVFGASGSGTTTLGVALGAALRLPHLELDDFYWQDTPLAYTVKHPPRVRVALMRQRLQGHDEWVLSGGSLHAWGQDFVPELTLAVFLHLPTDQRMARLRERERQRYGDTLLTDAALRERHQAFLLWAEGYETVGKGDRSWPRHQAWLAEMPCPSLRLDSRAPVDELVAAVRHRLA